ncbi:hypothetical protein HN799_05530 [Candidatus Woesearchaeota archaeon]|nr:hypothetical protein [Candidatus Woesearchaeota archaeon]
MAVSIAIRVGPKLVLAACMALAACTQSIGIAPPAKDVAGSTETQAAFTSFPDMPLPTKVDLDMERTMIFGSGDAWFGRLSINTSFGANEMFDFYQEHLPGYGWQEVTSLRSATSVLTYTRQNRVATIQIQERTIRGSEVTVTVSPRGLPKASPQAGSAVPAPIQPVQRIR